MRMVLLNLLRRIPCRVCLRLMEWFLITVGIRMFIMKDHLLLRCLRIRRLRDMVVGMGMVMVIVISLFFMLLLLDRYIW